MTKLPECNRLKIEKAVEDKVYPSDFRGYLGISEIGKECPRELWYGFRFCSKKTFSARINRLLKRGHREELIIIADLKEAGVNIFSTQECRKRGYKVVKMESGEEQIELTSGYGHIKGHPDGIGNRISDDPQTVHLLEYKTMADKYFRIIKKNGLKVSNPVYYTQCQCCMELIKLNRTLFISVNKNDDSRYYENILLEKTFAEDSIKRGESIIFSEIPPPRFETFKCSWCTHFAVCKEAKKPNKNCRTCQHGDMENKGKWSCSNSIGRDKGAHGLSMQKQLWLETDDCSEYKILKTLEV